jgi:hypothetical protein
MTLTARRQVAAAPAIPSTRPRDHAWSQAVEIRRAWLARGLATEPADRSATERSLSAIYARLHRPRPQFVWVDSPHQALPLVTGFPTNDVLWQWIQPRHPGGAPPLASDLAAELSRLRGGLDEAITPPASEPPPPKRKKSEPWPRLAPKDALDQEVPFLEIVRQGVREALRTSLADGLYLPVRRALAGDRPLPTVWYGQQESSWIAYYDVCRELGLARFEPSDEENLNHWATLASSCGWWWPGEDNCVVVERPATIRMQPLPRGLHEEVRLSHGPGPAIEYRDGWYPLLR